MLILLEKYSKGYQNHSIDNVQKAKEEEHSRQTPEILIVLAPNTVVEPLAVVVEF